MSDLRERIADALYPGGTQSCYVDYLEKADELIELVNQDIPYTKAYRAGWNDALAAVSRLINKSIQE